MSPAKTRGKAAKPVSTADRLKRIETRLDVVVERLKAMQQDIWQLAHPAKPEEETSDAASDTQAATETAAEGA